MKTSCWWFIWLFYNMWCDVDLRVVVAAKEIFLHGTGYLQNSYGCHFLCGLLVSCLISWLCPTLFQHWAESFMSVFTCFRINWPPVLCDSVKCHKIIVASRWKVTGGNILKSSVGSWGEWILRLCSNIIWACKLSRIYACTIVMI